MKKIILALMVAALAVALAAPAFADTTISGRIRWDAGWKADSKELTDNGDSDIISGFMSVSGSSFMRLVHESDDKKVGLWLEIGLGGTVNRRATFAWYTIGNCKLVAGNNFTWAGDGVIGQSSWLIDVTDGGFGLTYQDRRPMIALEWRSGDFGVQVGLFEPKMSLAGVDDFRWVLPTLNVTVDMKFGAIQVAPAAGIVHYLWESDNGDDSLVAWFVGVPAKISFGPVSVKMAFMYAVNGADDFGGNDLAVPILNAGGEIEDSSSYGGWAEVVFSSGAISVAGGAAWVTIDNDTYVASNINQFKYYVHLQYMVHANFKIRPEVGYVDYADDKNDNEAGGSFQVGLRFQFDF